MDTISSLSPELVGTGLVAIVGLASMARNLFKAPVAAAPVPVMANNVAETAVPMPHVVLQ